MGTKLHIRRNDIVVARSGSAASGGKTGKVLQVFPGAGRAIVEGLNYIHKTLRKSQDNPKGGIVQKEAPLAAALLMLYCPRCKKGVRAVHKPNEKGRRGRQCRKCGYPFDG
jgi:large subunit ribosomal protein L24